MSRKQLQMGHRHWDTSFADFKRAETAEKSQENHNPYRSETKRNPKEILILQQICSRIPNVWMHTLSVTLATHGPQQHKKKCIEAGEGAPEMKMKQPQKEDDDAEKQAGG